MFIKIRREQIEPLTRLNCDHVIFSGNELQHCNKNNNDVNVAPVVIHVGLGVGLKVF